MSPSSLKTIVVRKIAYLELLKKVNFKVSRHQLRIQFAAAVGRLYDLNSGFCYKIHPGWFSPLDKVELSAINWEHDFNYKPVTYNSLVTEYVFTFQSQSSGISSGETEV